MIITVDRNLPLRFFPFINEPIWFEDNFDRRFLLKCEKIEKNSKYLLKHANDGDIVFGYHKKPSKKGSVLFSANKEDLIKYTEKFDEVFDIYPVYSLAFRSVDFMLDSNYEWVVFTSKRAVEFFFKRVSVRFFCNKRLAAIGDSTAFALMSKGFRLDYVPKEHYSDNLIEFLKDKSNVLVVTAKKHNPIYDELDNISVIAAYENYIPDEIQYFTYPDKTFDFGLFSSPSAFWHIKEACSSYEFAKRIKTIVAIGKTTKRYIESCGFEALMAEDTSIEAMFELILKGV